VDGFGLILSFCLFVSLYGSFCFLLLFSVLVCLVSPFWIFFLIYGGLCLWACFVCVMGSLWLWFLVFVAGWMTKWFWLVGLVLVLEVVFVVTVYVRSVGLCFILSVGLYVIVCGSFSGCLILFGWIM